MLRARPMGGGDGASASANVDRTISVSHLHFAAAFMAGEDDEPIEEIKFCNPLLYLYN